MTDAVYTPCGGCGATKPWDRCLGCLHNFGGASWVPTQFNFYTGVQPDYAEQAIVGVVIGPPVEEAAERIYDALVYDGPVGTTRPKWVPGGNSEKQEEARRLARAALGVAT